METERTKELIMFALKKEKWRWIIPGVMCLGLAVRAGVLPTPEPTPDPNNFTTEQLYGPLKDGVDAGNIMGFMSGGCVARIEVVGIPLPIPLPVNHITMHVPDLLVNVAAQPHAYLWQDEARIPQDALTKLESGLMYGGMEIGGGVLHTRGGGLSITRHKDVAIYGNPTTLPPIVGAMKVKKWLNPKEWIWKFAGLKTEEAKGFYQLVPEKHKGEIRFGCITMLPPYKLVFNSEADYFWRLDLPYINQILALIPITVGPGWIPIGGGLIPGQEVLSGFFPLQGTVTNLIHAHGAFVNALRAAYITTGGWKDLAIWTLHFPRWWPFSLLQTCLSAECKFFTSRPAKLGGDTASTWQLIAPKLEVMPPPLDAMAFRDSKIYVDYLKLVDMVTSTTNPGEKYSFFNWRCHKCCDIPRGIKGVVSVEIVEVFDAFEGRCEPPYPNLDPITTFENALKKKLQQYQKKLEGGAGGGS